MLPRPPTRLALRLLRLGLLSSVFAWGCGDEAPEAGEVAATEQAATVDVDESYVIVGRRSVQLADRVTVQGGHVGVSFGAEQFPLAGEPCLAGGDPSACFFGEVALDVGRDTEGQGGSALFAESVRAEQGVRFDGVHYRTSLDAASAMLPEQTEVDARFFPLFPQLPEVPTAEPGSDLSGKGGTNDVPRNQTVCLPAGRHGSFRVQRGATLRLSPACGGGGAYELRDVQVDRDGALFVESGVEVQMRDLQISRGGRAGFAKVEVHARDVLADAGSELLFREVVFHARGLGLGKQAVARFEGPGESSLFVVADALFFDQQSQLNVENAAGTGPSPVVPGRVRIFVLGSDSGPAAPRHTVEIGPAAAVRANIMALPAPDELGGTITVGPQASVTGALFGEHVFVGSRATIQRDNTLVGDGAIDPDYRDGDVDNDGAPDASDICLTEPNAGQEDEDGDGFGDACDVCPAVGNPLQEPAACASPAGSYCGDGAIDPATGEACDDGYEAHGPDAPCDRFCQLNAPRIVASPADQTAPERGSATFSITASGIGLEYQWQRDGADLPGETGPTLTVGPLALPDDDGATFRCVVTNPVGSATSAAATLTVELAPPRLDASPGDVTAVEGEPATFTAAFAGTDLSYRWERDGAPIPGANAATYTLPAATLADDGATFRVVAENAAGAVTSMAATLAVELAPPVLVASPSSQSVIEGQPISFHVAAEGSLLTYQWRRDGVPIPGETSPSLFLVAAPRAWDGASLDVVVSNAAGSVTSDPATLSVALRAPTISAPPTDQTVQEGEPATFSVVAAGSELTYTWLRTRDGVDTPVPGVSAPSLTLPAATLEEDGDRYSVVVENAAGSVRSAFATLSVRPDAPVLRAEPADLTVDEGGVATFAVSAEGAQLTYQWHRDGVAIPGANAASYTLEPVALPDAGARFRCVVANVTGSVTSRDALLDVRRLPPRVLTAPVDVTTLEGEDATFTVVAEGSDLSYQWLQDGAPLAGATAATLTVPAVTRAQDGERYRVEVSNPAGAVTSAAATLRVELRAPSILGEPADVTAVEGESATFDVVAAGSELSYQWLRDGAPIAGATEPSLTLSSVARADAGTYRVRVANPAGEALSAPATLSVALAPPTLVRQPAPVRVVEGEEARFEVEAAGSELSYAWDCGAHDAGGAAGPVYVFTARYADDGLACRAIVSNDAGSVTSEAALLTVDLAPPRLVAPPADQAVVEGDTARFEVDAEGTLLSYAWRREGSPTVLGTGPSLEVAATRALDGAVYRVEVSNGAGAVSASATLTVSLVAPEVTAGPAAATVTEGETASFTCAGTGTEASWSWLRNGAVVAGATEPTLTVGPVAYAESGDTYACRLTNGAGEATSAAATLTVELAAPRLLAGLSEQTVTEGARATFAVSVEGSALSYAWTRDGAALPTTGPSHETGPATLADDGAVYAVVVSNAAGSVSASAALRVDRAAPVVESGPSSVTVAEGASATFAVSASGSDLSYQWLRGGVAVPGATAATYTLPEARYPADDGARFAVVVTNPTGAVTSAEATLSVTQVAPRIVSSPAAATVREGETASFTVEAEGSELSYQWVDGGGAPIAGATEATLVLPAVTLAEAGSYAAVVSNGAGSVTSAAATLTVERRAPELLVEPADATVVEGEGASFEVSASGTGLSYQWRRGGVALPGETGPTLSVGPVTLADDGATFSVAVSNDGGSVTSRAATLSVTQAPPRIITPPADRSVTEGEDATFTVDAEGSGLTYQWRRDGVDIPGAAGPSYTLVAAVLEDAGTFTVVVSNDAGSIISAPATLTVALAPPAILAEPVSVTAPERGDATFTVTATGTELAYEWLRDGAPIAGATASSHTLASVTLADDGATFRCRVSNAAGEALSASATLSVTLAPPLLTDEPADLTVVDGQPATFDGGALGSELTYRWQRDGVDIAGATEPSFTLPAATLADDGATFRLVAENAAGSVTSRAATLRVTQAPPVIVTDPVDVAIAEGEPASFTVAATGSALAYQWEDGDGPITGATGPTLELPSATLADDGRVFRCVVRNEVGEVTSLLATLTVALAPPRLSSSPADLAVSEGESATFSVVATGSELAYQWQRDGVDIAGATSPTYTLPEAERADDGARFRCQVSNGAGSVLSDPAALTVALRPPSISSPPTDQAVVEGETATFTVVATGSELAYVWRREGSPTVLGTGSSLEVAATRALDGAVYRVEVSNGAGAVSASATLTVSLVAPEVTAGPAAATVTEGETASFTCAGTGTEASWSWLRNGAVVAGATEPTLTVGPVAYAESGDTYACRLTNGAGEATSAAATLTVELAAPRLLAGLSEQTVTEGARATFAVSVEGSALSYAWTRDGAALPTTGPSHETGPATLADDGAVYAVVVSNAAGSVSASAALRVDRAAPVVESGPSSVTVAEGASATFAVSASGSDLSYQWLRGGVAVPGATAATYTLPEARYPADDGARFAVVVTNPTGAVTSAEATLSVTQVAPRIVSSPAAATVREGETASFTVEAEGSELSYQWVDGGGAPIAGATEATLVLPAVTLAEAGSYAAVVSNGAGSVTSAAATLTVERRAPELLVEPADATVVEGEGASFEVSASGTGLSYQWRRGGVALPGETGPTLSVGPVTLADDGATFSVAVSNDGGSVTSRAATLSVTQAPPRIITPPADRSVTEGEDATFTVDAEGSGLTYQWRRDGVDIPGAVTASYTLSSAPRSADGATFQVVVSNDAGSVTSTPATLSVALGVPVITTGPADQTVDDGAPAYFACVAEGSELAYQWQRDGADIPGAQDETYTLPAASLADDGVRFRCVVTSPAGSASAEATLSVLPSAPTIAAAPSDVSVTEGEAATFAVVAEGSAPLAYQWSRNGAPIDGASAANYTLPAASLADDGAVFAVTVSNASGEEARASATLRVELAPPRIVDSPTSVTVDEGEAVELSVAAEGSELAYQWERDGAPLEGATAATYTFTARYADRGAYCVVVTNGAGSVTSAAALVEVRLAPPTITTEPTDLSVAEGAPASFAVEASGAALSYQWEDDDGPIAGATEASFTLATTTLADDGRSFRVRVRNDAAEVVSRVAVLTVDPAPPRITSQPASLAVTEGEPASFAVVAEGTALTYQWFKDAVPLAGATDATLSVGATTLADAGVYHCEVSNAGATVASAQATLSVRLVPPVLTAEPAGVTVRDGEAATFTVAATGSDLSYRWQRFGVDVPGATSPTYTLTASYADDGASFVAIVSNSGGSVSSAPAVLRVLDEVAPELHLEGAPTRITEDGLLRLVGTATDAGVGLEGVTVRSDRFADQTFGATLGDAGTFEVEVPLEVGPNALTVTARDRAGNETTTPVTVTRELPLLPRIVITEPLLGLRTEAEQVTVAGRVETRLDRTEIRLSLAEQVAFPTATTGTEGVYEFRFDNVPLRSGRNVLTVQGQTPYGTVSGQTVVAREDPSTDGGVSGDSGATNDAPRIRLPYASAQLYRTTDLIPVRGTVSDDRCVDRVLVNGEPADQIGAGAEVSFEATLSFTDAGSPIVPIEIEAHDCDGESTRIAITAFLDDGPPEVVLTGIGSAPTITPVLRTPYPLSGTVRDPNIASFTVAGVSVPLMPTDDPSLWTFETRVPLARRVERTVVAEGRDLAGNRGRAEVVLRLDAELELSLEAPVDGDRLIGRGDTVEVPVRVRAPGLAPGDTLQATLDGAMERPLSGSGSLFSTSFTDIANGEEHVLAVTARSSDGRLLASATADFELVNEATLPLELVRSTPANGASGVEANQYVVLSFNRPVDPSLLQIEVRETVHGEVYGDAGEAADVRTASIVRRERIDREREPVPGSLQNLPGDQAVAFYPSRDLGYGGMVYVDVLHEGEEVAHFSFDVRPTPTLLMGFVADHELNPLPEIEVTIPELGLSTRTNRDGNFDFGFGWPADRALPSGTYRLLINPGRRISAYGAMDRLVTIRAEQLNRAGLVMLPWLDPESPFQPVASGERARLANGDLELDLTAASLSFPDGQRRGAVHTQLMERRRIGYTLRPPYHPDWGWSLQPGGIRVEGAVGVSMTMPLLGGSHEYLDTLQELHLLVALDQESLEIVPVGVLRLDRDARRVDAVRPVELDRLDYLAFARVGAEHQPLLARYASGELSLSELLAHLEASLP